MAYSWLGQSSRFARGIVVVLTKTDYGTRGMHEAAKRFFMDEVIARIGE